LNVRLHPEADDVSRLRYRCTRRGTPRRTR
jgi:hypothetical protein